jgi:hypothetical protein
MAKPTFLIPGASKGGTTSLHYYLDEHPEIYTTDVKELRFFDRTANYNNGVDYYESYFQGTELKHRGETSPPYWYHGITFDEDGNYQWDPVDDVAKRVAENYPNIKLIFTLRNPIDRSYSQYWKNVRQAREYASTYQDALKEELKGGRTHKNSELCWIYKNKITTHLNRWLDFFDCDQIQIYIFERWIQNPERVLNDICEFLGVKKLGNWNRIPKEKNPSTSPRSRKLNYFIRNKINYPLISHLNRILNIKKGYPKMDKRTREFSREVFQPVIDHTSEFLGDELSVWRIADSN